MGPSGQAMRRALSSVDASGTDGFISISFSTPKEPLSFVKVTSASKRRVTLCKEETSSFFQGPEKGVWCHLVVGKPTQTWQGKYEALG